MGKVTSINQFEGTIDGISFYKRKGKCAPGEKVVLRRNSLRNPPPWNERGNMPMSLKTRPNL